MADAKTPTNYEKYILPHQLPAVRPRHDAGDPDEQFFIPTHQAFEIWFAQALAELEHARALLAQPAPAYVPESDVPTIEQHVRRAAAIFDLVRQHLPLLETLKTTSFYNFRRNLFGASGTQSYRFRECEWLMGLMDENLLDYTRQKVELDRALSSAALKETAAGSQRGQRDSASATRVAVPSEKEYETLQQYQSSWTSRLDARQQLLPGEFVGMDATRNALQRRLLDIRNNGSLRTMVFEWLARTKFPEPAGSQPASRFGEIFSERYEQAYLKAHANDSDFMRNLQGISSAEIARINREAQQRTRVFFAKPHRRSIVFLLQFSNLPLLAWPASLIEALLALDQAFANWRDRHIAMVARVLGGGRISTLGSASSGLPYLRGTVAKRVFPEIWDARTFMLSDEEAKDIYTRSELAPYRFVHEQAQDKDAI